MTPFWAPRRLTTHPHLLSQFLVCRDRQIPTDIQSPLATRGTARSIIDTKMRCRCCVAPRPSSLSSRGIAEEVSTSPLRA
jgi:hypothetical protein